MEGIYPTAILLLFGLGGLTFGHVPVGMRWQDTEKGDLNGGASGKWFSVGCVKRGKIIF